VCGFASERVRDNYERASALCVAAGGAAQLFGILYARWYLHAMRAERKETLALVAEIDALARRLRTREHGRLADSVMVRTAVYDARFAEADRRMQRLLARRERAAVRVAPVAHGPDPVTVATSHAAIGLWFLGHPERARRAARSALARARAAGHFFTLAAVLTQAALVELLCRNVAEGIDLAEQAMTLSAEHGFAFWNALASLLTGWALVQEGRVSEGRAAIERALTAMQATGTRFFSAFAYAFLAEGHLRAGAFADGLAAVDAGLAVAQATLNRPYEPELWRLKGELLAGQANGTLAKSNARAAVHKMAGPAEQGEACFQRALESARATQAKALELRAATSLARTWHARGRTAEARRLLGGVCKWFGARAGTADLVEARALLAEWAKVR